MPKGYSHLTPDERCQIEVLLKRGDSQHEIARLLGRSVSTIRREIGRNHGRRGYRKKQADRKARERRSAASRRPKKMSREVTDLIEGKL